MGRPNRDFEHLGRLRDFYSVHRALPPYAELSKLLGFRAKNAAHKLASRLVESGFLVVGPGRRLVPGARFFERPAMTEFVPAGTGEAGELSGGFDLYEIDRMLVDDPSRTVLIKVRGDSMRDAGVLDGDTAVVERSKTAAAGEFVVALVDGQYTLKELQFESGRPVLMPHNAEFQPISPSSSLAVFGVVRGIVRRYPRTTPGAASKTRGDAR
jgi:repressor LexA